jgi:hypothetical protein
MSLCNRRIVQRELSRAGEAAKGRLPGSSTHAVDGEAEPRDGVEIEGLDLLAAGLQRFIAKISSRIRARHEPVRDKRETFVYAVALLELGLELMETAMQAGTQRQQAVAYRDGLLIAFLTLIPIRRKNLADFAIGRTLVQVGDDSDRALRPHSRQDGGRLRAPRESARLHVRRCYDMGDRGSRHRALHPHTSVTARRSPWNAPTRCR